MKTTFLLHGGRLRNKDARNDLYFQELTKNLSSGDTLLHVAFARSADKREEAFNNERSWILAQTDKDINIVAATKDGFMDQVSHAKTIHITGGDSAMLIETIKKYPDFISSLQGKLVGGSSAGACLFSTCYWSGSSNEVLEGLGTLPISLLVHYGSKEFNCGDNALRKLMRRSRGLELLKLEEAEWIEREFSSRW